MVKVVDSGSIPTVIYGIVVPLPLTFKFTFVSFSYQNLTDDEPFIDMLWSFVFMYRYMLFK